MSCPECYGDGGPGGMPCAYCDSTGARDDLQDLTMWQPVIFLPGKLRSPGRPRQYPGMPKAQRVFGLDKTVRTL